MALVGYSDSEASDDESASILAAPPATSVKTVSHATFQKTATRKIKVDLPSTTAPPVVEADDLHAPPAKRAKTSGGFAGFNSLLPAPKRTTPASGNGSLKKGVSLKTSAEAAFSRDVVDAGGDSSVEPVLKPDVASNADTSAAPPTEVEVKLVGRATRFKPLSVANNRRKPALKKAKPPSDATATDAPPPIATTSSTLSPQVEEPPLKKQPKRSLFSVDHEEAPLPALEPPSLHPHSPTPPQPSELSSQYAPPSTTTTPATHDLQSIATDLNLTPAQRRHLFGRNAKDNHLPTVAHFDMDSEYASNEKLRQSGEAATEHRAVKSIAPGKHSLQQLVNNARSNQDGMEDKWAEGRRARGEGGSKYGFGR